MTTELVLLLAIIAFISFGVIFGRGGPGGTFEQSAPRLGARIEAELETGSQFSGSSKRPEWLSPEGMPPKRN